MMSDLFPNRNVKSGDASPVMAPRQVVGWVWRQPARLSAPRNLPGLHSPSKLLGFTEVTCCVAISSTPDTTHLRPQPAHFKLSPGTLRRQFPSPKGASHHSEGLPSLSEATLVPAIKSGKQTHRSLFTPSPPAASSTHHRRRQHEHGTHGPLSIRVPFVIPASAFIRHSSF